MSALINNLINENLVPLKPYESARRSLTAIRHVSPKQ